MTVKVTFIDNSREVVYTGLDQQLVNRLINSISEHTTWATWKGWRNHSLSRAVKRVEVSDDQS